MLIQIVCIKMFIGYWSKSNNLICDYFIFFCMKTFFEIEKDSLISINDVSIDHFIYC